LSRLALRSSILVEICGFTEWLVFGLQPQHGEAQVNGRSGPSTKLCKGRFLRIAAIGADPSEREFTARSCRSGMSALAASRPSPPYP